MSCEASFDWISFCLRNYLFWQAAIFAQILAVHSVNATPTSHAHGLRFRWHDLPFRLPDEPHKLDAPEQMPTLGLAAVNLNLFTILLRLMG